MATKWHSTKFPGVRYREHNTKKHGVGKDKYFAIRYQKDGKRKEEGLGWATEGWSANKAAVVLAELKKGFVTGEGPTRLSEKREAAKEKKDQKQARKREEEIDALNFGKFFEETYFPQSKPNKSPRSWAREDQFYRLWIFPVIGEKLLKKISPLDLERIKKNMADVGRAPRSIHYCLAVIRQVFNFARALGLYEGDHPVSKIKKPKVDNRRLRFLTKEEASRLLKDLKLRSQQLHDMALISLHCGLRAGEIFDLTWSDVYLEHGVLMLKDTKGGTNRPAFMTGDVTNMLGSLERGGPGDLVFADRIGNKVKRISNAFSKAVKNLGLNEGVEDKRYLVTFHSLRHTFASWLVENGTDLYTVKELLGHSTLTMTERYSQLSNGKLQKAVHDLDRSLANRTSNDLQSALKAKTNGE